MMKKNSLLAFGGGMIYCFRQLLLVEEGWKLSYELSRQSRGKTENIWDWKAVEVLQGHLFRRKGYFVAFVDVFVQCWRGWTRLGPKVIDWEPLEQPETGSWPAQFVAVLWATLRLGHTLASSEWDKCTSRMSRWSRIWKLKRNRNREWTNPMVRKRQC